ncbi:hypothetical protein G7046_g3288 [Stylonectria norvegica]|nr:hypothetical protein G7046_g3288 [Stylonectria norvegica]
MVPWIDADALGSQFGTDLMSLAQRKRPVLLAILAISSYQLTLTRQPKGTFEQSLTLRKDSERDLAAEDSNTRLIVRALLALTHFFDSAPSKWKKQSFYGSSDHVEEISHGPVTEPLQTLIRFHLRFDLATSILAAEPPTMTLSPFLPQSDSDSTNPQSNLIYDSCLYNLASCLQLINVNPESSTTTTSWLQLTPYANFAASWSSLWSTCIQWYTNRPSMWKPLLEIQSVEAGQIDTDSSSSFPIKVFTTRGAMQANLVYHLTCLLLLSRKPRLMKLLHSQRHLMSQNWHAQQIAGIATRNCFEDQWDPITIAGLFYVARDLTHRSQQEASLACLLRVSAKTGLGFDQDIKTLRSHWNTSMTG